MLDFSIHETDAALPAGDVATSESEAEDAYTDVSYRVVGGGVMMGNPSKLMIDYTLKL